EYDVLVLPHGEGYGRAFGTEQDEWLKAWVRSGGVLVGIGKGAAHLCRPDAGFTGVRVVEDLRKTECGMRNAECGVGEASGAPTAASGSGGTVPDASSQAPAAA